MSALDTTIRRERGCVLLVGRSPACDSIGALLDRPPKQAVNLYDALGEVTMAPAGEPIAAIVVPAELARRSPQATAAFRRIDPSVRLVLLLDDSASAADSAIDASFDAVIGPSIDRQAVAAAVVGDDRSPQPSAPPAGRDRERPQQQIEDEAPRERGRDEPVAPTTPPIEHAPATEIPAPPSAAHALGDVDLVEAILNDPDGLATQAMQLIIQQTGWNDAQLVTDASADVNPDAVAVTYAGETFGRLVAPAASARELQPWAEWLARWLALDRGYRKYRQLAYRDDLTSAWNRRFFELFLESAIAEARDARRQITLMVFDIDDFKRYNDTFGHEAGDEILRETVRLLTSVIRKGDRVCRIGGDEFAVIFADPEAPRTPGSSHPETVEQLARRFQDQICQMKFPKLGAEAKATLSISAGLATFPWDSHEPAGLLRLADQRALRSKQRGKNAITFGPKSAEECDGAS